MFLVVVRFIFGDVTFHKWAVTIHKWAVTIHKSAVTIHKCDEDNHISELTTHKSEEKIEITIINRKFLKFIFSP